MSSSTSNFPRPLDVAGKDYCRHAAYAKAHCVRSAAAAVALQSNAASRKLLLTYNTLVTSQCTSLDLSTLSDSQHADPLHDTFDPLSFRGSKVS